MIFLVTDIEWDTDGEPVEDCNLPSNVLVVGTDDVEEAESDDWEQLSSALSDTFGFCHYGFQVSAWSSNENFPDRLGVIESPY